MKAEKASLVKLQKRRGEVCAVEKSLPPLEEGGVRVKKTEEDGGKDMSLHMKVSVWCS